MKINDIIESAIKSSYTMPRKISLFRILMGVYSGSAGILFFGAFISIITVIYYIPPLRPEQSISGLILGTILAIVLFSIPMLIALKLYNRVRHGLIVTAKIIGIDNEMLKTRKGIYVKIELLVNHPNGDFKHEFCGEFFDKSRVPPTGSSIIVVASPTNNDIYFICDSIRDVQLI